MSPYDVDGLLDWTTANNPYTNYTAAVPGPDLYRWRFSHGLLARGLGGG